MNSIRGFSLQWRHNVCDGVSNNQHHDCLFNHLFRRRSKKTSKLRVTGLCAGISPVTGGFLAQMASNAEYVSIWWRHHMLCLVVVMMILYLRIRLVDQVLFQYRLSLPISSRVTSLALGQSYDFPNAREITYNPSVLMCVEITDAPKL